MKSANKARLRIALRCLEASGRGFRFSEVYMRESELYNVGPKKMRIPVFITVFAVLSGPVLADDRMPAEETVRAFYSASEKADQKKIVHLMHTSFLEKFQRATISRIELSYGKRGIRNIFSGYGVASFDEVRAMDSQEFYLRSFKQGEIFYPGQTTIKIVAVTSNEDAYIVDVEVTSKFDPYTFRQRTKHRIVKEGGHFKIASISRSKETAKDQQGEEADAGNADQ